MELKLPRAGTALFIDKKDGKRRFVILNFNKGDSQINVNVVAGYVANENRYKCRSLRDYPNMKDRRFTILQTDFDERFEYGGGVPIASGESFKVRYRAQKGKPSGAMTKQVTIIEKSHNSATGESWYMHDDIGTPQMWLTETEFWQRFESVESPVQSHPTQNWR
jgi:hypothetical protein